MVRIIPLVNNFLDKHPADCARILEHLPVSEAGALISSVRPRLAATVMEYMFTFYGSECLRSVDPHIAAAIIKEMKAPQAARLLRAVEQEKSREILGILPSHIRGSIHSSLRYPENTVGRIMDSNPFTLPDSVSLADAVKRVKGIRSQTMDEIFVVDDNHALKGVVHISDLLSAGRSSSLQSILKSEVPRLSTRTALDAAAVHSGWQEFSTLPVVGKGHILSGILKSSTLMRMLAESRDAKDRDSVNEIFSMTKMYWTVMAELVNTVAGNMKDRSGKPDAR